MRCFSHFILALVLSNLYLLPLTAEVTNLKIESFGKSRTWKKFLLYEGRKSHVTGGTFFLSPEGRFHPLSELKATLKFFSEDEKGTSACTYPARRRLLIREGLLPEDGKICLPLQEWKRRLKGDSVSVVFATQFISNPASAMGHTFLRIHDAKSEDFLHTSIGYAANVDETDGPLTYAAKGLAGHYQGLFFEGPFYEKVHEYVNMEQRDIWSYELELSPEQRTLLLDLIWELKHTARISYYFLDGNCSSFILSLTQAVAPEKKIRTSFFPYAAPYQTIQALSAAGLVRRETYRPSLRNQLLHAYESLTAEEKEAFHQSFSTKKAPEVSEHDLLDALIYRSLYAKQRNEGRMSEKERTYYYELIAARAEKKTVTTENASTSENSPLKSHLPRQVDLKTGRHINERFYESVTLRPGAHQYMDKQTGFLSHSSFSFFETELLHEQERGSLTLNRLTLFDLKSVVPWSAVDPRPSFKVLVESKRLDVYCPGCQRTAMEFFLGAGLSQKRFDLNVFFGVQEEISSHFARGHATWVAGEIELLSDVGRNRFRLSHVLARGPHEDRMTQTAQYRHHDVFPHLHAGADLKAQSLLKGDWVFEQSLVLSYDY